MATAAEQLYVYKGKDRRGNPTKGELKGKSVNIIKAQLRKQGINATSVKKKPQPLFSSGKKPIKPADIAVFTRQMATMMRAGVPLVQSFDIVAEGSTKQTLTELILTIKDDISSGLSFASALRKHPKFFDDLYCSLVEAGEQSGTLEVMLSRIATYKEKTEKLKAKVRKALTYPAAVIAVGIIVMGILLVKVIPVFAQTFTEFGADLPSFTLFVLGISEAAQQYWLFWLIGLVGAAYGIREAHRRSPDFAYAIDKYSLRIPLIGNILYEGIVARFARTLSTTFAAGVPLVDALTSVANSSGNRVYKDALIKVKEDVTTGITLTQALRSTGRFPVMLLQMASIGEESGALDDMLERAAEHFEESVDNAVDNLTALLEPLIMSVLGVIVGAMLIAMYLPIFKLGAVI